MAAYTMQSDKIFLRCFDIGSVEVYELDSPYIFPVKGKHWSRVGISIGPGNKYEALKIGENEVKGDVLEVLSKDLFHSRLLINREGLCFISTGITAPLLEVEYYRLFDLYNWSKLCVNASLNTRWARSDFIDGCPLDIGDDKGDDEQEKLREKEKELEEEKRKHEREIKEVKRVMEEELEKKQEEIDKLAEADGKNQKELKERQDEIDKLNKELAEAESKNQKELKKKQNEITESNRKHKKELVGERNKIQDLEKELKKYVYKRSGLSINEFYRRMVVDMQTNLPPSKISFKFDEYRSQLQEIVYKPTAPSRLMGLPFKSVQSVSTIETQTVKCGVSLSHHDFDLDNWRVLTFIPFFYIKLDVGTTLAYYDGNRYQMKIGDYGEETIPAPCPPLKYRKYDLHIDSIIGVGSRVVIDFGPFLINENSTR